MNTFPTIAVPLPHLAVIEARGADADAFLQGQLSNDVRRLTATQAQLSSFNSAKGRMLAVLHLLRATDAILLELHRDVLDATLKRLRMYVLRSKVTLQPGTQALFGVAGPEAPVVLSQLGLAAPTAPLECAWTGEIAVVRRLGDAPRYTALVPGARVDEIKAKLRTLSTTGDVDAWKRLELEAGMPTVYPATQDHFVPQMCNLDALGGISFDKGCYTGQEVVARVHYKGAVKRHMKLERLATPAPAPGTKLDAGEIVDSAPNADGGSVALVIAAD